MKGTNLRLPPIHFAGRMNRYNCVIRLRARANAGALTSLRHIRNTIEMPSQVTAALEKMGTKAEDAGHKKC